MHVFFLVIQHYLLYIPSDLTIGALRSDNWTSTVLMGVVQKITHVNEDPIR